MKVSRTKVARQSGYLYYLGSDGYVWQSPRAGMRGSKKRIGNEKIMRKPGYLYYVDKDGFVGASKK